MSQLFNTMGCIAYSRDVDITFEDCNDAVTMRIVKNGIMILSITMSRKQLDLLLDNAEDYLESKPIISALERFWEDL